LQHTLCGAGVAGAHLLGDGAAEAGVGQFVACGAEGIYTTQAVFENEKARMVRIAGVFYKSYFLADVATAFPYSYFVAHQRTRSYSRFNSLLRQAHRQMNQRRSGHVKVYIQGVRTGCSEYGKLERVGAGGFADKAQPFGLPGARDAGAALRA